jgi:hypothetical protein
VADEAQLAVAEQHVREAERIVARQRQAIARLRSQGFETTEAEQMLVRRSSLLDIISRKSQRPLQASAGLANYISN